MIMYLIVKKRSIKEEERHTKGAGLNFIPFDNRATDIVAAN